MAEWLTFLATVALYIFVLTIVTTVFVCVVTWTAVWLPSSPSWKCPASSQHRNTLPPHHWTAAMLQPGSTPGGGTAPMVAYHHPR